MNSRPSLQPKALVKAVLDRSLESQRPLAIKNVQRLRHVHPDKAPEELITLLNRYYLGVVATTGAGAGMAAVVPNGVAQGTATIADFGTSLEASIFYILSIFEVYGIDIEDIERRRFLVLTAMLGENAASQTINSLAERSVPYWSKKIIQSIPMSTISAANKVLGPRFITKYGAKQGVLVLGKQLPLCIGAGIGAGGNALIGWGVIKTARRILGPAPSPWTEVDSPAISRTDL